MDKKSVLLSWSLTAVVAGAVAVWWFQSDTGIADPAPPTSAAAEAAATAAAGAAQDHDATAPRAPADELRSPVATAAADTPRPIAEDARWIELRVVDGASHASVAGASVGWVMEGGSAHVQNWALGDSRSRLDWDSTDRQVELRGWRTTSDAEGIARVALRRWTIVVAESGGRAGRLELMENTVVPPGGYVLELVPDLQLTVRVEDDLGAPAADVLVAIGSYDDQGKLRSFWNRAPLAVTRAPDGVAVLAHLQQQLAAELADTEPAAAAQLRVRTWVPGFDDAGVEFALDRLPAEPIVLRLPPCGRARVRGESGGRALPGFRRVLLQSSVPDRSRDDEPPVPTVLRAVGDDGWVHFPHLPVGQGFRATCCENGRLTADFAGPSVRGQEVTVAITPRGDAVHVRGRLIDEERHPLARMQFRIQTWGERFRAFSEFLTDADGVFLVCLGPAAEDAAIDRLNISQSYTRPAALGVDLPARTLRLGVEDLGEITLSFGDLLVSGHFVDEAGRSCPDVGCSLEHLATAEDGTDRWQQVAHSTSTDGDGRFAVRGTVPPGRLRLTFGSYGSLPMPPVEFTRGTLDLEVRIARGHELAACLLQTRGTPDEALHAELLPNEPHPELDTIADGRARFRSTPWTEDGEHQHLQWQALPAGSYTLAVHMWTHTQPVAVVPDVQVPGPPGGDPRLAAIDVRAAMRPVTIHLSDTEGHPIEANAIAFAIDTTSAKEWSGFYLWEATSTAMVPASGTVELLVGAYGYQPRRVLVNAPTLDVRLDPWPTIRIDIGDVPALPARAELRVGLESETRDTTPYHSQIGNGTCGEFFDVPDSIRVTDGHADAPIGQGPHRLSLYLNAEHGSYAFGPLEPAMVLPTSGRVRVTVPPEQWAAALAAITAPPK